MHFKIILFLLFLLFPAQESRCADSTSAQHDTSLRLSPAERAYVKNLPPLRYSGDPDWLPYEAFTADGSHVGVAADILKLLTERTGIKISKLRPESWVQTIEWMRNGDIDIFSDTDDSILNQNIIFTKPYITDHVVIVSVNANEYQLSAEDIIHKRIALVKDYGYVNAFMQKYSNLNIVSVKTVTEAFEAVKEGKADYTITSEYEAARMIFLKFNDLRIVGYTGLDTRLAFGFHPRYKAMVPIFNKAIDTLSDEDRMNIKNRWIPSKVEVNNNSKELTYLGSIFVFVLLLGFYIYRNLKKELAFRRQLQLELTREKNKFEALFNNSSDANAILINGKYADCNQACSDLYKLSKEMIIGKTPDEISPTYQPDGERSSIKAQQIFSEMASKGHMRFQWMHMNSLGQSVWCDIIITKIIYNGQVAIYSQLRNIDDIKNLEASLIELKVKAEQASIAKSQFLANMSHEIRTPMNAVLGFAEMLEGSTGLSDEQIGYIKSIKSGAKSLLQIINDILDLSKIEAGKLQIKAHAFDIIHFLDDLRMVFSVLMEQKGLKFAIEYPQNMPKTWVMDDIRLRQILFNLIGNAMKFTENGGTTLKILTTLHDDAHTMDVLLKVIDTGVGIAPADQRKIFHDFEQSDDQDTRKYGGTGLGLAISKKLALIMNGDIYVKSELGIGSEFGVSFNNVSYTDTPLDNTTVVNDVMYTFKPATILSVDDVELNLLLIKNRLAKYPFEIIDAMNGEEALEKLQSHTFDLILLDLQMPIMDGYMLKQRLNESEQFKDIPVIALTAAVSDVDNQKLEGLKFDCVLSKPLSNEELLAGISRFIPSTHEEHQVKHEEVIVFHPLEKNMRELYIREFGAFLSEDQLNHSFARLSELVEGLEQFVENHPHDDLRNLSDKLKKAIEQFNVSDIDAVVKILRHYMENEVL